MSNPEFALDDDELEVLKLVALGCNRGCYDALEKIFRKREIVSWSVNDYFLLKPLSKSLAHDNLPCQTSVGDGTSNWTWESEPDRPELYFPFFERRLRVQPFVVDVVHGRSADPMGVDLEDPAQVVWHLLRWPIRANNRHFLKVLRSHFGQFVSHLPDNS